MTRRDKWAKRPVVMRYHTFCDELRLYVKDLPDDFCINFNISMPKSWSKKKKEQMKGRPHQEKPDIDNLLKAVLDAICKEDKQVWNIHARKFWTAAEGNITIWKEDN